jgi:acyl-CoA thioesterase FadM
VRWIRLLFIIFCAKHRKKLSIAEESNIVFRVWPTDIDLSIMNHSAMLTVMEMGRIDFMVRSGFHKLARKKKWYYPIGGINVQFFRPLKLFQKANLITRVFYVDEKWIYIEQKIIRNNRDIAFCIVKSTIKKGKETISTNYIAKALKINELPTQGEQIVCSLIKGDDLIRQRLSSY